MVSLRTGEGRFGFMRILHHRSTIMGVWDWVAMSLCFFVGLIWGRNLGMEFLRQELRDERLAHGKTKDDLMLERRLNESVRLARRAGR